MHSFYVVIYIYIYIYIYIWRNAKTLTNFTKKKLTNVVATNVINDTLRR